MSSGPFGTCTTSARRRSELKPKDDKFACQEAITDYIIESGVGSSGLGHRGNFTLGIKAMFHIEEDREYVSDHEYEWF